MLCSLRVSAERYAVQAERNLDFVKIMQAISREKTAQVPYVLIKSSPQELK